MEVGAQIPFTCIPATLLDTGAAADAPSSLDLFLE